MMLEVPGVTSVVLFLVVQYRDVSGLGALPSSFELCRFCDYLYLNVIIRPPDIVCRRTYILPVFLSSSSSFFFFFAA